MQRLGGYPRFWHRSGEHWDGLTPVPDAEVPEYEAGWRAVGVRVEWLRSPHGRLDAVLPQTVERYVHNAQTFGWRKHGTRVT